jgi:hypothetical protein
VPGLRAQTRVQSMHASVGEKRGRAKPDLHRVWHAGYSLAGVKYSVSSAGSSGAQGSHRESRRREHGTKWVAAVHLEGSAQGRHLPSGGGAALKNLPRMQSAIHCALAAATTSVSGGAPAMLSHRLQ